MSVSIDDDFRIALDHAWQWFALHRKQRMQTLYFHMISAGFLANAYIISIKDHSKLGIGVGALGGISSLLFFQLERRNRHFVTLGKRALRPLEQRLANVVRDPNLVLVEDDFDESSPPENRKMERFSTLIPLYILICAVLFFTAAVISAFE